MRKSSAALAVSIAAPMALKSRTKTEAAQPAPGYWNKGTRLAISMWDFSWLRSGYPGGPFEDLERCVAEASARGYNTLRVDCFPSRVPNAKSHFEKNWNPKLNVPQWGQCAVAFSCHVRKKVSELAELCRKHGLWLGLDSWDKPDMFGNDNVIVEANEEGEFTRYGQIWVRALKMFREDGVLERAIWIAPMNEVPHFGGRHLQAIVDLHQKHQGMAPSERTKQEDGIYRRVNGWMAAPIHEEITREQIPISYSSLAAENYGARLTDHYDLVDVHFMPGVIHDAEDDKEFKGVPFGLGFPGGNVPVFAGQNLVNNTPDCNLAEFSKAWATACRRHYAAMLERARHFHKSALTRLVLPSGKKLDAIITEAFGPCFFPDHPQVNWDWYKRYNADCLRLVAEMDFKGSSLSNYAEPLFSLWHDVDWHRAGTIYFLNNFRRTKGSVLEK